MRSAIRARHYSSRTEEAYIRWSKPYIFFHVAKRVTCHTRGQDIRTVQELLGRRDVATTMISTHVLQLGAKAVRSTLNPL